MPSTHTSLHFHLVFSTKNREAWLSAEASDRLHHYLGGVIRGLDAHPHAVGGVADHVHLAVGLKPTHRLSDVMRELKSESSRWLHEEMKLAGFAWQEGYGAFSFGAQDLEKVRSYVLNQPQHHRVKTFQEEYVEMLKRGLVEYDDKYLW
jgi:REP element-mobilizing transposase RayT